MKAAVYNNSNLIEIKQMDKPRLIDKGAIIKVHACGLCGSDIVKLKHKLIKNGDVLGHEVVGEIVEINSDSTTFKIGDKVALGHHYPCFECQYCKGESYSMCKAFKKTNIFPGGFCEYIYVTQGHLDNTVAKIPSNLTFEQASYMEPLACCLRAVNRANIKNGDEILISGLGSIGLLMGQVAKHFGARVTGCDLLDERLELALRLGFDDIVKYSTEEETSSLYKSKAGEIGADKVFLVSGAKSALPFSLKVIRDGGTIVVFSSLNDYEFGFANNEIYYRELSIIGSYSPSPKDLHEALSLIEKNSVKVDGLAKKYTLDDINIAIEQTLENKIIKAYIEV